MKKLLLSILVCTPFFVKAQTFTNTTGGPIPDNNTEVCYPVTVSGLPTMIDATFGLSQACINLNHTYDSDIKIRLKSPDGTVILLSGNNGGSGDNYTNSCFAMNATVAIGAGAAPFTGTFIPNQSLNTVNNMQDPNGVWYLCIVDEVPADSGHLYSFNITFSANPPADPVVTGPCSVANGGGCFCPDGSTDCDLLPDMTASALIITNEHTETPGMLTLSNATPNIGWGPMEIHGSNSCWCDTVNVACTTVMCPDGSYPKQKLLQTIYHKSGTIITSHDTLTTGMMSYHPSHGHIHVDNWAEFTLRTPTPNPDATTWPILATGSKISFCLINLGDCTSSFGYCKDGNYGTTITQADIPNSGFGSVTGCGTDQGIYVGNLDVYSQGLAGMSMDLTGVCNGDYYIVSITDPDNNFIESNETNNWAAAPITLTQQIPPPVASFTYTASGPFIQFNNPPSVTYTYQWYFGDGGTSTNQNPSHTYTANGVYNVTEIVMGNCGNDTTTQIITVTGVGINESVAASLGFSVYPNPISDNTTISYFLPEHADVIFELYDVLGKKVYSVSKGKQDMGHYEFNINMKGLEFPEGVYILKLRTETRTAAIRITRIE
jgi:PKD repeat protein/subtilisin-like proprotein convertase family protein